MEPITRVPAVWLTLFAFVSGARNCAREMKQLHANVLRRPSTSSPKQHTHTHIGPGVGDVSCSSVGHP